MIEPKPEGQGEPSQSGAMASDSSSETRVSDLEAGICDEKKEEAGEISNTSPSDDDDPDAVNSLAASATQQPEPTSVTGRILSRISTKSSVNPGPPPDGGWQAWMIVLSSHIVIMNTWGIINTFGVFQPYYTTLLSRPPADISWIGSFEVFLLFFIGTFTGRLTDAGYFRPLFAVGTFLVVLGAFATSWCTQYWQIFLAQGVCMGIGNGCLFCPSVAVLSTYFEKRTALMIGIAACGSATGGLIYPSIVRQLLPQVGFGWTMRTIGFIQLATMLFSGVFMKPRLPPRKTGSIVEWAAFKELEYTFYAIGSFFCFWGVYFGFYYLAAYSRTMLNSPMSSTESLNLILVLNGVGVIGRLVPNYFADRFGTINLFIPTAFATGLFMYCWMAVSSPAGLYIWAVFYGIAAGGVQALFPAGVSRLTTDMSKQGTRMGMIFTIVSFAVLTGTPIAGAIISGTGGRYLGAQAFAGTSLAVGTGFLGAAKMVRVRRMGQGFWVKV